ncbi:hypothetical protein [Dictyobacter aurantiacus]|uniref:Uncharacterized protein n=1 Tax=Dictyobacter aurantiacus TaxID=1936993 RepID=A0A401ZFU3_9CHLR|nr:hypothetical protein [Dictyobacter aurantiacus]GCE05754.1 hypothetical protein KDAU_30830 [Dictyobacter aurantiacus]
MSDVRRVHVEGSIWVEAEQVRWDTDDEQWGTALIGGEEYAVIWSNDGDGYTEIADSDLEWFRTINPGFYDGSCR